MPRKKGSLKGYCHRPSLWEDRASQLASTGLTPGRPGGFQAGAMNPGSLSVLDEQVAAPLRWDTTSLPHPEHPRRPLLSFPCDSAVQRDLTSPGLIAFQIMCAECVWSGNGGSLTRGLQDMKMIRKHGTERMLY